MLLILVRHGETEYNRDGLALGRADAALDDRGVRQAAALEFALAEEKITAIYASPRSRTLATAEPIARAHGLQVVQDDRLLEMDVGVLEGLPFATVREKYPGVLERWMTPEGAFAPLPGSTERLADVQVRARAAIDAIAARHVDETVVVVTHNFVILALLCSLIGLELGEFRRLRQSVAAISRLDLRGERVQVLTLNDTCHLAGI
jgi:broad specificity phosphatase PhoE